jgi:UDP-MurNAc hydroxylase
VRITDIGHAGLLIETTGGTVVCDPWFTPAYFGSWFPFPRNDGLSDEVMAAIADCDVLYVSHSHKDHLDERFLAEHVNKDATVLLPDFSIPLLKDELQAVGFHDFVHCPDREWVDLGDGLRVAIMALDAPNVGPMGDSSLLVEDPTGRILNQNDAHPSNLDFASADGGTDIHLLQHSGAIWFPMVYDLPDEEKARLVEAKRRRQVDRASAYLAMVDAPHFVPMAGPPCFLDDELFAFNDLPESPTIFPDGPWFLEQQRARGNDRGVDTIPGTTIELVDGEVTFPDGPVDADEHARIYDRKEAYLRTYAEDWADWLAEEKQRWATGEEGPLLPALEEWLGPLIAEAEHTRAGIGAAVGLVAGEERMVLDFPLGVVRAWREGEHPAFWFRFPRELLATAVRDRLPDWVNTLLLSCRFAAHRDGPYNEFVYTFFKSLSAERMAYCERYYADHSGPGNRPLEWVEVDGWVVEKRCPHQGAHLDRVGDVDGTTITCGLHGWAFDLETGACLNSEGEGTSLRVRGRADRISEYGGDERHEEPADVATTPPTAVPDGPLERHSAP